MDAGVQVVTAYPITPQTTVVEKLSELVGEAEFLERGQNVEYVRMESEHSVMAALIGASLTGARTFTATSGQGLLYMAEMVHWAAGTRLPLVCSIASRGIAPPWNIWADFSDIVSMRDSGVMIQFLGSHQEIYDTVLMSYAITEHRDVLLPMFPAYGGFVLSHTSKPVHRIPYEDAQAFLPAVPAEGWPHVFVDVERPMMHGNLIMPNGFYTEFRAKIHEAQMNAKQVIRDVTARFAQKFGRKYGNGLVDPYRCDDADVIIINMGGIAKQNEDAVDQLREEGYRAGALRLRTFRPFPTEDILEYARKVKALGVVDRDIAYGSPTGGAASTETTATCMRDAATKNLPVIPFIAGLGGRDVTLAEQVNQYKMLYRLVEEGEVPPTKELFYGTYWTGLLREEGH
jgi:2-oxoisovalerate ferredoxin oxidoreductase alpha subunit